MKPFRIAAILLAGCFVFLPPAPSDAQSGAKANPTLTPKPIPVDPSGASYKARVISNAEVATPFALNAPPDERVDPLRFLPREQMSATDRSLAANADAQVRQAATLAGLDFDKGNWSVRQLVCRALPGHLFLIFETDNGPGDVSVFSAAIPRGAGGGVRVIPIERRGYSLFSPAPVNAITVAAFNRIRAGEPENKSADWLATGLCYAALAGAHPVLSATKDRPGAARAHSPATLDFPPTLEVAASGDSTVRFVDVADERRPSEWALTFSQKGRLLSVDHFATPNFAVTPVPAK